jgi:hypothetical protein
VKSTVEGAEELLMVALDSAVDINAAREYSTRLLVKINGLLNVSLGVGGHIERVQLVEYFGDGSRTTKKHIADVFRYTTLSGLHYRPPPQIPLLRPLKDEDQQLYEELMNRWGQPDAFNFSGLYKIYELVRAMDKELVDSERFKKRIDLFRHTANHSDTGLNARHAVSTTKPPASPLPISLAIGLIRELSAEFVNRRGWDVDSA